MKLLSCMAVLTLFTMSCSSPFLKYEDAERLNIDDGIPDVTVKEIRTDDPNLQKGSEGAKLGLGPPDGSMKTAGDGAIDNSNLGKSSKKAKRGKSSRIQGPSLNEMGSSSGPRDGELGASFHSSKKGVSKGKSSKSKSSKSKSMDSKAIGRLPIYESTLGFSNGSRRPDKDPFRAGEKVVMSVKYFKAQAGEMTLEVKPMVEVNGRRSYRWVTALKTTGMFSKFYSIQDVAETLVDYESLLPSVYTLQVKETAQLRNGKGYFDPKTRKGIYIEKKYTESKGQQEKRQEWEIEPYAQNVFSAAFYMRVFNYEVGKDFRFKVSDDEKNLVFLGKVLRREKINTEAGSFNTIVIKPEFEIDGVFKPVGDIYFWMTDDDRKLIVRIESEIKIGTLVMDAISVDFGS